MTSSSCSSPSLYVPNQSLACGRRHMPVIPPRRTSVQARSASRRRGAKGVFFSSPRLAIRTRLRLLFRLDNVSSSCRLYLRTHKPSSERCAGLSLNNAFHASHSQSAVPGSSPVLATCWICSRFSQVLIVYHAFKQPTGCLLPVGVFNPVMLYLNYLYVILQRLGRSYSRSVVFRFFQQFKRT